MTKTLALLLLVAACGDNNHASDDSPVDAGVDAAPALPQAVIVAGDFTPGHPGVMSALDIGSRTIKTNVAPAGAIGEDPILRKKGDELLVVNRASGNNVTILDASTFALVEQLGTGAGTNPQDVAIIGDKLFVATLGNKGGVVLTRGSTAVEAIDLSIDDPDGKPNCSSVYYANNNLYFACGLLDDTNVNLPPRGPGRIYVVNPTTNTIKQTITMNTNNPIALFEQIPMGAPHGGDLLLPTIDFGTGLGCVERIATSGTLGSAGCVVDNSELGTFAFASRVAFSNPTTPSSATPLMFLGVASYPMGFVRNYDLASNMMLPGALTASTQVVNDLAICPGGELVIGDNPPPPSTAPNGLRVYQGSTEKTTTPLAIGLKPASSHGLVCY
ncbi:hypothetical protein BH11MYX3_BH11MYX3_00740 [soil metagenome]